MRIIKRFAVDNAFSGFAPATIALAKLAIRSVAGRIVRLSSRWYGHGQGGEKAD